MLVEIVTEDANTDASAMSSADEVLGYCAALAMADPRGGPMLTAIK